MEFKFVDEVEVVELRVKSLILSESWALMREKEQMGD